MQDSPSAPPQLIKDQLFPEAGFLRFCNSGYIEDHHRLQLSTEFLDAARQDGLIVPLLEETGTDSPTPTRYYSPHQLFLAVALRKNIIKEGRLTSEEQMAFGPGSYRTILWGPSLGITVDAASGQPIGSPVTLDLASIVKSFHDFLRLIHSMPQTRSYTRKSAHRQRHFRGAPSIDFDLTEFTKSPTEKLSAFSLTVEELKALRYVIGSLATSIDPLEYWNDYLTLHPQARKDLFKGEALIAQELYLTADLVADVIAIATGAPPPPLMRFLYEKTKFKPFLMDRDEYASGRDTSALKACATAVQAWVDDKAAPDLVPDTLKAKLVAAKDHLAEFVQRHGEKSYLSGVSRTVELDDTPLAQLEDDVRQQAEAMGSDDADEDDGSDLFNSLGFRVAQAIEYKLDSISHELGEAIFEIRDLIQDKRDRAWRSLQDSEMWMKPQDEQRELHDEAKRWDSVADDFSDAWKDFHSVYCGVCRERPAPLHHEHYDSRVSDEPICDQCFAKVASGALKMSDTDWQNVKGGEWYCDYGCVTDKGRPVLLYRFARRNTVSTIGQTKAPLRIELEYGRMRVEAKCPKCNREQSREIDWGWVD